VPVDVCAGHRTTRLDAAMTLKETVLSEFDDEIAMTRRLLQRLPDGALGWKPHERSMSLGGLAAHLAQIPHWGESILEHTGYNLDQAGANRAVELLSREAVLDTFDRHAANVRRTLVDRPDGDLLVPWSLTRGEQLIMSLPRVSALRRFVLNHLVHHRGQMTVYLRMQNVPLPPLYGPTADEGM
jgi:uncharacterized damage-inducible protein DinB